MVFMPELMEGHWDFLIWDTDGFIAEGKETNMMNHSLILKTLEGIPVTSAHSSLAKASHVAKPDLHHPPPPTPGEGSKSSSTKQ